MALLLTISITAVAQDKAITTSRFCTPQKDVDVPDWLQIFDRKEQPKQQTMFKSASTSTMSASSAASSSSSSSTDLAISLPSLSYKDVMSGRSYGRVSTTVPEYTFRAVSYAPMSVKETSRAIAYTVGAGANTSAGTSCVSSGSHTSGSTIYAGCSQTITASVTSFKSSRPSASSKGETTGLAYRGTTYAPFDDAVPSDYAEGVGNTPRHLSGRRNGFGGGPEWGEGPCPVGEPWILAIFAAMFSGIIAWRKRTATK